MKYEIRYTSAFIRNLKQFKKSKNLLIELKKVIKSLEKNPNNKGKQLRKNLFPNKSIRILKKYRLIFEIKENTVFLKAIGHRENIYK